MKTRFLLSLAGLLLGLSMPCAAQTTPAYAVQNAPPPSILTVTNTGTTGSVQYCYWVVAVYPNGKSAPSGPLCTFIANATLSATNYNTVTFSAPTSPLAAVTSYDLLRTTSQTPPSGACACAVSTAQSGSPLNDQSNTLSAYTVSTLATVPLQTSTAFYCGATTGTTTCPNTSVGTPRWLGGVATLASNSAVISGISPAFTATTTFSCVGNDITTRANPVQVISTSTTSITITNTTGASDVINWVCVGY